MGDLWTHDALDSLMVDLLLAHSLSLLFLSLLQHLLVFYQLLLYGRIAPTVLKVMSGMDNTRGSIEVNIWLFQLTRTTIADYWRTRARDSTCSLEVLLDSGWEGPTEEPRSVNNTAANQVQLLLPALPARYREVLTCRYLLHLSIRDTARRMGLTVANVKVVQFRALKRAAELAPSVFGS
jgi:RNA polymerase sigma-70 factor, ECF subfamily